MAPVYSGTRCYDPTIRLSSEPLVLVVIPTAGKIAEIGGRKIDLLVNCLTCIVEISSYKNLEFVVVDNGNLNAAQRSHLDALNTRTITYDDPIFNVAKKLNLGVSASRGKLLLLLNDDIEPLTPDWIERLLEHFEKPHVGRRRSQVDFPRRKNSACRRRNQLPEPRSCSPLVFASR